MRTAYLMALVFSAFAMNHLGAAPAIKPVLTERCADTEGEDEIDLASINASIERAFKDGRAPRIFYALGKDRHSVLKKLLAAGENPNTCHAGVSPLMVAAVSGDFEAVAILLHGGAHPRQTTRCRWQYAAGFGTEHGAIFSSHIAT